jgi:hypothetical protein
VRRRKRSSDETAEKAGPGSESGQRDAEGGNRTKRVEPVDQRSDESWLRLEYAASERRVCGLMDGGIELWAAARVAVPGGRSSDPQVHASRVSTTAQPHPTCGQSRAA